MRKNVILVALAAALVLIGVGLLRATGGASADARPAVVASTRAAVRADVKVVPVPVAPAAPRAAPPTPAEVPDDPPMHGPSAAVWNVLGKPHATPAEERTELLAALNGSPGCTDPWCGTARGTLESWTAALGRKLPGAVSPDRVQCSAAGCWMAMAVSDPGKWREVSAAIPDITMGAGWQGPTILTQPDWQSSTRTATALWVLLPAVHQEQPTPREGG